MQVESGSWLWHGYSYHVPADRRGKCIIRESALLPISASIIRNRGRQLSRKRRRRRRKKKRTNVTGRIFRRKKMHELPHDGRPAPPPQRKPHGSNFKSQTDQGSSSHAVTPTLQRAVSDTNSLVMDSWLQQSGNMYEAFWPLCA